MSTWAEQTTDFFGELTDEAIEHAGRHGFEPHEDYDGYAYIGNGHRDAVFRVLSHVDGRVSVEVLGMTSSVSLQTIDAREFVGFSQHPDAAFMDLLEDALVDAKRQCSC